MKVRIFLSNPSEPVSLVLSNPLDGMARLYVALEDKYGNLYGVEKHVVPILKKRFNGATLVPSRGLWKGKIEDGVVITIVADLRGSRPETVERNWKVFVSKVKALGGRLAAKLRQDAVMIEFIPPGIAQFGFK